jgi:hypothetical protein
MNYEEDPRSFPDIRGVNPLPRKHRSSKSLQKRIMNQRLPHRSNLQQNFLNRKNNLYEHLSNKRCHLLYLIRTYPNGRTLQRQNGKRIITRNSFEIYEDQMDSLRKLSFQEKMEGKLGSMSGMVREAIDTYLSKRTTDK